MGFFDSGKDVDYYHAAVNPRGSGQSGRRYLEQLLASVGNFQAPTQQIAGMTGTEQNAQGVLADILSGKTFRDPNTSQYYSGLRESSINDENRAAAALRNRQGMTGMYNSGRAINQEGQLRSDFANDRNVTLGGLYNQESARDNPYTRLQAVSQYGALPRQIEQQQMTADYNKILMDLLFPYETGANLAQQIVGNEVWTGPTVTQTPSGFSQVSSAVNSFAPLAAILTSGLSNLAAPTTAAASGGSSGLSSSFTNLANSWLPQTSGQTNPYQSLYYR